MRKVKLLLTGFAILSIIGSSLAFNASNLFHDASVYCTNTCLSTPVLFKADPTGFNTTPCGSGIQPYVMSVCGGAWVCAATPVGTKFKAVVDSGK